jgi:hypothetical protein
MRSVDLAWALAAAIDGHLDAAMRNMIYVTLGSGDTYRAILASVSIAAKERVALPQELIDALLDWNAAHDDTGARLSGVISSVPILHRSPDVVVRQKIRPLTPVRDYRHSGSRPGAPPTTTRSWRA